MAGFSLAEGMDLSGVALSDLWWRYATLGGHAEPQLLWQEISGEAEVTSREHDLIAQALNEYFMDQSIDSFPVGYSAPPEPGTPVPEVKPGFVRTGQAALTRQNAALMRQRASQTRQQSQALFRRSFALRQQAARLATRPA